MSAKFFKKHSSPSSSGHQLGFHRCATCIGHFTKVTDLIYISMCLCFHTLDSSLNAYLSNMIFDPLLDNSLLAIHTATMPLSLWVKLRDASLDAQENPPSHVHHRDERLETGTAMYHWMHKTHPLMCIASQARLRLDNADAHLPTTQDNLDAKKQNAH